MAPILAQARNAAAACQVMGRLNVACQLLRLDFQRIHFPGCNSLDGHSVTLLDTVALEDIGNSASLLHELLVRNLTGLGGLVGLVDDGGLFRVLVEVSVKTVVSSVQGTFGAAKSSVKSSTPRAFPHFTHNH